MEHQCGKCGSTANFVIPATPGDHSHIVVGERLMRNIQISRLVCTNCGFVEEWIKDQEDLKCLKDQYRGELKSASRSTV
jgi:ribosomal protein S27AE